MELAYCQRCGCFYEDRDSEVGEYVVTRVIASKVDHVQVSEVGLCPKCMNSFVDWLHALRTEEGE